MKKAYLYFLAPLVAVALFGGYYWSFSTKLEQRHEQRAQEKRAKKEAEILQENRNREKAILEAQKAQNERRTAKAEKEARDAKDKEDRELAEGGRRKAIADTAKLEDRVRRLTKEIEEAKKELQGVEEEKTQALAEEKHLKEYVALAVANRASLQTVVEKIDAADKAFEIAAREAARAALAAKKK